MRRILSARLAVACIVVLIASVLLAAGAINLNTASQKDLETLKGVGPATARKIIAGRPYASVDDLAKAGLSAKLIQELKPLVTVSGPAAPAAAAAKPTAPKAAPAHAVPAKSVTVPAALIDLNTASEKDLEALKGVGPATAKKIIAGRPYTSADGLAKAGLSAKLIGELKPFVTVSAHAAPAVAAATPSAPTAAPARAVSAKSVTMPAALVDLNTASEKDLEALKGVGPATSKKIIAGRPYASVDELAKAGLSAKLIGELKPFVTVSAPAVARTTTSAPVVAAAPVAPATQVKAPAAPAPAPVPAVPASSPAVTTTAVAKHATPKLAPGQMVNLNTATKEELDALPEIGPVKAQAIIDGRPYSKIEDVMKVKGIKQGIFDKIKEHITVK